MASVDASAFDNTIAESRRWPMRRVLAAFVVALALISSVLTFAVLTGLTPIVPGDEVVALFLVINSGAILLLIGIILVEFWLMIQARRRGRAAARLHVQIVALFSAIAMVPAIYVAVVAYVTIDRGLDRLFSKTTRAAVENAWIIANGYMNEHAQLIGGDALALAQDLARARVLFDQDPGSFTNVLRASASYRKLLGAVIIDADTHIVAATDQQDVINGVFDIPNQEDLVNLSEDKPSIVVFAPKNNVAAALRLRGFDNLFLIVAQSLDPDAVLRVQQTRESLDRYNDQEATRPGVQKALGLMFAVIALTVLMSAVLIALNFANSLVEPIRRLMGAADLVSTGNLNVQVPVLRSEGDLAQLGKTFNKMTDELRTQRDDLVRASEVIDSRRRFTEAVLSSASAGIIGVDGDGKIGDFEPLVGEADRPPRGGSARPSACGDRPRARRNHGERARGRTAPGAGPDHGQPRRARPHPVGACLRRAVWPVA